MKNKRLVAVFTEMFAILFIAFFAPIAAAGNGHDHADAAPSPVAAALPRVLAQSDLFELVGIVAGKQMRVYLDHHDSNEPVAGAQIQAEISGATGKPVNVAAKPQADATYLLEADVFAGSATLAISFTIVAGTQTDLLAGDLVLAAEAARVAEADHHDHGGLEDVWAHASAMTRVAAVLSSFLALALLVAGAVKWLRKRRARSSLRGVSIALAAVFGALVHLTPWLAAPAWAGPGHDHGNESGPARSGNSPKRQADGSVFLPKPSQRQLAVRTQVVQSAEHAPTTELQGRVVVDANGLGRVQATQQGRIEAGPRGLPQLGQSVRKGDVLGVVRFSVNALERGSQQAQKGQLDVELIAAEARLRRLEQLDGIVAPKEVDAARAEAAIARRRIDALAPALNASEPLLAPISGIISAVNVAIGQVVDARELVFEVLDPSRLVVEALAFDSGPRLGTEGAFAVLGPDSSVPLIAMAAAPVMRDAARVLRFKPSGPLATRLVLNQPVRVLAQDTQRIQGSLVPAAALAKNPSNQDVVWVHTGPEQFEPRVVRWALLDAARVIITDGLAASDRVVTQGAALVNQVR